MKIFLPLIITLFSFQLLAQNEPTNGLKESKPACYALRNATIIASPDKTYQNATVIIRNNKIEQIGLVLTIPANAVEIDCKGKTIVPAFIDLHSNIGLPKVEALKSSSRRPQLDTKKKGAYYWNESIHPEINANELFSSNEKTNKDLIEKGFGFALTHQFDGIARGEAAFVSLGDPSSAHLPLPNSTSVYSLKKGVSHQTYPSSQMGSIALLRQAFYDAQWYSSNSDELNLSLQAINNQVSGNLFFETDDRKEILRGQKIADEFGYTFNYFGSGNEYQNIHDLKQLAKFIVVPINFPKAYDVKNPYIARQIPISDLKHWEMAPKNPGLLARNNVPFAITAKDTKTAKEFWENLRKAISNGLSAEDALNALTLSPATVLGMDSLVGSLEKGKYASFIIYDGNPFTKPCQLLESWLMGDRTIFNDLPLHDIAGNYNLQLGDDRYPMEISKSEDKFKGKLTYSVKNEKTGELIDTTTKIFVDLQQNDITLQFLLNDTQLSGNVSLQGKVNSRMGVFEGEGLLPNGDWIKWTAIRNKKGKSKNKKDPKPIVDSTIYTWYPNMAYGFDTIPALKTTIIKNATLWTNEEEGIIENGMVIIVDGKISYVGPNKSVPGGSVRVIDAKGKHVTSGIIDEHSHIAISKGVNEGGQSISAEVSIGDVVNPDDINIYRQLSGGVTASQLLHGSANPVGGQSALIKLKWGHTAEDMLIDDAPKFIKFALGENVKQSNWGDNNTVRFPQTRMGVEQVYYDGFIRAREYEAAKKKYSAGEIAVQPPMDLELEALSEILREERFITCHSYIQSEINMLMHVADSMGFTINTFTHILEGYKVADKMAEHGAGGSTFSDWWAYKYEVNDAIPYNAKIMHDQGVVVAINSDDAEMGRRLNQEAAKGVKYGGMSEEDAWKMVTLNPAKLLHLDDRMGSLKVGKDADVVVWSDNPLSINAKVEQTFVDGLVLYDHRADRELRKRNQQERARIITKMMDAGKNGESTRKFFKKKRGAYHCDTLGEEMSTEENHH